MSQLKFNTLQGVGNVVRVQQPNTLYAPGHIVNVSYTVAMQRAYYQAPNQDGGYRDDYSGGPGGDLRGGQWQQGGNIVRPLDVTITPSSVNSWIFVEFNVFYECPNDVVFTILRDGQLVGAQWGSGYDEGRWNGAGSGRYDNNNDSTPDYINLPWIDRPGTLEPVTYSFAVKSSNGSNQDFILNATFSNYLNGSDNYEQGVSFAIAKEIAY